MVVHASDLSSHTQEAEARGSEFEASLISIASSRSAKETLPQEAKQNPGVPNKQTKPPTHCFTPAAAS